MFGRPINTGCCEVANDEFRLELRLASRPTLAVGCGDQRCAPRPIYGYRLGGSQEPVGPRGLVLIQPSLLQVPRPSLPEVRCLLLFAAALAAAATLGCTGLVAYTGRLTPVWCFPGATFAP